MTTPDCTTSLQEDVLNEQKTTTFEPLVLTGPEDTDEEKSVSNVSSAFFEGMGDHCSALPAVSNDDLDLFKEVLEGDEWPCDDDTTPSNPLMDFDFESLVAVLLPEATPSPVLAGQVALAGSSSATADDETLNPKTSFEDEALNGLYYHEACSSHSMSQSPPTSPTASEGRVQHSKRSREASESSAEAVPKQSGAMKKSKAQIEEERLQKRLAKNRRTAAQSRERKKQAMKEMSSEVQGLKDENTRLKHELEVQKMHTQLLREELASFARSAKEGTADAAAEPAALLSTTTLPSVHDTVMTMQRRSVPSSSNSQLVAVWSVLACLYLTSQTAGSVIETLSKLATTHPEAAASLVKALSESGAGAKLMMTTSPSAIAQRIAPDRCSDLRALTPWRSSSPQIEMQTV